MKHKTIAVTVLLAMGAVPGWGQFGGFGGPSILSSGTGRVGGTGGRPMQASWFAGVQTFYYTGLTPVSTDRAGTIPDASDYGLWGNVGVRVNRVRSRSGTSLSANAGYGYFRRATSFSGAQGSLEIADTRQKSQRLAWHNSLTAFTTNFAGANFFYFSDLPVAQVGNPGGEIFDNRVYMVSGATGVTYTPSVRWTFTGEAGLFGTSRRTSSFADVRGVLGRGSAAYSLSRRTAVGVSYSYNYFFFPHGFGEVRAQTVMATFSRQLNRYWWLHLAAGPIQTFGERLQSVPIDPIVAALTGQTSGIEVFRGTTRTMAAQGSLNGRFRRSSANVEYFRGVMPGNGIYVSSFMEYISAGYSIPRGRDWSFGANANYNRMKPLTQTIASSEFYTMNGIVNYRLAAQLALSFSAGIWRTDALNSSLSRNRLVASVGLTYTSNDLPFRIF